jgi:glyoxylase-like metal-dependent hydrolase (beta-lactamase superfamily II)
MAQDATGGQPLTIDLRYLDVEGVIAAFLLRGAGEAALIETGPGSTAATLLAALDQARVAPQEVRHLLVTHVHLDHAGASGLLLERFPHATLYAHEAGIPHLVDPSKLIASATRIYGAMMKRLWGEIVPVPADRVVPLHDGQRLEVAGRALDVLYTPGHAKHHVCFHDPVRGEVYTGDTAGVRIQGYAYVRPPTPPPDLDLDAWESSLDRLAALAPTAFYVTHFGRSEGTADQLATLRRQLRLWEGVVLEGMREGQDTETIAATLRRIAEPDLVQQASARIVRRYEMASGYAMNVAGYERYLRKRHPELSPPTSA